MNTSVRNALIFAVVLVFSGIAAFLFLPTSQIERSNHAKPTVVTTLYHLSYFTAAIASDLVDVVPLVPAGFDAHDYEPTFSDRAKMQNASLVLLNGAGIDSWAKELHDRVAPNVAILDLSQKVKLQLLGQEPDPHYWLDLSNAKLECDAIAETLGSLLPQHKERFEANANLIKSKLAQLDDANKKRFASCEKKELFVTHNAFGYLAGQYGFSVVSLLGVHPEGEPSLKSMDMMVKKMSEVKAAAIFYETGAEPSFLKTICDRLNIKSRPLYTLESMPLGGKAGDYVTLMGENFSMMSNAMECR